LYVLNVLAVPVLLMLALCTVICCVILLRDPTFDRKQLWNSAGFRGRRAVMLRGFAINAVVITLAVVVFDRESLFAFIRQAPAIWAIIMVFYPLVSVYPQELIYRAFFFHRYRQLFPKRWTMIAASAAVFGYMHIVFENPLAVVMTLIGGWLFARTYERSRSVLACTVEHALYGCFIFTIGLGLHFYHGAVR
jgi:membrane protease YdiL (CAAX protease family)